jgi:nitroreductase
MEFKEAVGLRRTIRYFQPYRPVEKAKVQKVLEAARLQSMHGNAQLTRRAVVVTQGETPDDVRDGLIDALYAQPQAAQAPVAIVWFQDMDGWAGFRDNLIELVDTHVLSSSYGWSKEFIENNIAKIPDFNPPAGERTFAEWLTAFECGLAVGAALLAATDEGLGTALVTGRREEIRKLFDMPDSCTPTQVQLLGYAAECIDGGGQRPRPDFSRLYFEHTWGNPMPRDPAVVAELETARMLTAPAPHPWRKAELRALAGMFGLPE